MTDRDFDKENGNVRVSFFMLSLLIYFLLFTKYSLNTIPATISTRPM